MRTKFCSLTTKKYILLLLLIFVASNIYKSHSADAIDPTSCKDISFIFVRGSGQALNDHEYQTWKGDIDNKLQPTSITYDSYELGAEPAMGDDVYPAVPVGIIHPLRDVGASLSNGQWFSYGRSVNKGVKELTEYINLVTSTCPSAQIVIGGYSQGAQVAGETLDKLTDSTKKHVTFTALFGDPRLDLPEGYGLFPAACSGKNLSPWRRTVPECTTSAGSLNGGPYYMADSIFSQRVGLWCARHDYICGSSRFVWDTAGHGTYKETGGAIESAIDEAIGRATAKLPDALVAQLAQPGQHDIVINSTIDCDLNVTDQTFIDTQNTWRELQQYVQTTNGRDVINDYVHFVDEPYRYTGEDLVQHVLTYGTYIPLRANTPLIIYTFICNPPARGFAAVQARTTFRLANITLPTATPSDSKLFTFTPTNNDLPCITSQNSACLPLDATSAEVASASLTDPPNIAFRMDTYRTEPGKLIHFDARPYYESTQQPTTYAWDFDGDGTTDATTDMAVTDHTYTKSYSGQVTVTARASSGAVSAASASVVVTDNSYPSQPPLPAPENLAVKKASASSVVLSWELVGTEPLYWMLNVNGAPLGTLPGNRRSFSLYDVDFSQPVDVSLAPVASDGAVGKWAEAKLLTLMSPSSVNQAFSIDSIINTPPSTGQRSDSDQNNDTPNISSSQARQAKKRGSKDSASLYIVAGIGGLSLITIGTIGSIVWRRYDRRRL